MTQQEITTERQNINSKLTKVIIGLVARNMEAGDTYEEAQQHAFNRMKKEQPELLNLWMDLN